MPGSDRLAALSLVLGNVVMPAAMFDAIAEPCEARLPNASPGIVHNLARHCPGVLALHGWRRRRRLDRAARDMRRRTGRAVLYHETNMIARPFTGPTVVTMHDLSWRAHPELYPPAFVAWIERRLPATLRQATRFVSVSEFTARAMVKNWVSIEGGSMLSRLGFRRFFARCRHMRRCPRWRVSG